MKKINQKNRLLLLLLLILAASLLGLFYFVYITGRIVPRAATPQGATLSFSAGAVSFPVDSTFPVNIVLNTGDYESTTTDVFITYDSNFLEVQDTDETTSGIQIQKGTIFTNYMGLLNGNEEVDPANNMIGLTGYSDISTPNFRGVGTFATITFKAKAATASTQVTFDPNNTIVGFLDADNNPQNILSQIINASFAIIGPPTNVSVDLKANGSDGPLTVASGASVTLSWTSQNAASCTASNAWSGTKATSGSESSGAITSSKTYTLTCTADQNNASDSVSFTVSGGDGGRPKPSPPESPPEPPPTEIPPEEPTIEPPPTEEPTEPPIIIESPIIPESPGASPTITSPSPFLSPSPKSKSPSPSPSPKVGGFKMTPTVAALLYIGIPVVVAAGAYYFWWWWRRKKTAPSEPPPKDEDEFLQ